MLRCTKIDKIKCLKNDVDYEDYLEADEEQPLQGGNNIELETKEIVTEQPLNGSNINAEVNSEGVSAGDKSE